MELLQHLLVYSSKAKRKIAIIILSTFLFISFLKIVTNWPQLIANSVDCALSMYFVVLIFLLKIPRLTEVVTIIIFWG